LDLGLTLFLAAVFLVGFWVLRQRLALIEERTRQLPVEGEVDALLEPLRQQLQAVRKLAVEMKALRTEVVSLSERQSQEDLQGSVTEPLRRLEEELAELRRQSDQLLRRVSPQDPLDAADPLTECLVRHLERDGYGFIRVLSDLEAADPIEEHRVPVEARRAGVLFKGVVTLYEGRVAEVALKPSYEAFP
jgi:hypothetical protein